MAEPSSPHTRTGALTLLLLTIQYIKAFATLEAKKNTVVEWTAKVWSVDHAPDYTVVCGYLKGYKDFEGNQNFTVGATYRFTYRYLRTNQWGDDVNELLSYEKQ
jgi:hypothetical protein